MIDKEKQNIEWKETWKEDYLKWICGFANTQGGKIYIGKMMMEQLQELQMPKSFWKIFLIK